jgi:MFS transporter, DHA2 family, multidrug resistance protein
LVDRLLDLAVGDRHAVFFLPLTTISMSSVNRDEIANAAGMQNFIRTMAGAVATSFVATAWDDGANKSHAELISAMGTLSGGFSGGSDAGVAAIEATGVDHATAIGMFQNMVESQALMISTNQIMFGSAVVFALCSTMAFFLPKAKSGVDTSSAH